MKNNTLKNISMGFVFLLVNITSVAVVTNVMGLNLPLAFLMTGINTILFHIITKRKLASVIGVSGLYIGSIIIISEKYSQEYAMGGVILAGLIYVITSFLFYKFDKIIFKYIPKWIVSFSIILIGLSLVGIGSDLVKDNLLVGLVAIATVILVEFKAKGTLRLFSMPIGIALATIVDTLLNGFTLSEMQKMAFIFPKFNLESFLSISLIAFAVMFEAIGDCENTSDVMGFDVRKEIGLHRILFANGLGTILGGFVGVAPATTYSEQNSALILTKYKDTKAEIWTSILFILLAFASPITIIILSIPQAAFGGVLLYLYASVIVNGIKQLGEDNSLKSSKKKFIIISVMLGLFFISFSIKGISISSIAISMIAGIILNSLIKEGDEYDNE